MARRMTLTQDVRSPSGGAEGKGHRYFHRFYPKTVCRSARENSQIKVWGIKKNKKVRIKNVNLNL